MKTVEEQVIAGIAALDMHAPKGWRDKMNLKTLNVATFGACPLKQAFGSFGEGVDTIFGDENTDKDRCGNHGFDIFSGQLHSDNSQQCYDDLSKEWVKQLS